jgi:hypothetical protein
MTNLLSSIGLIILILFLIAVFIVIFQLLWNSTMPPVFSVREIGFWQAFRLLLIAAFLFGGGKLVSYNSPQNYSGLESKVDGLAQKLDVINARLARHP